MLYYVQSTLSTCAHCGHAYYSPTTLQDLLSVLSALPVPQETGETSLDIHTELITASVIQ